MASDLVGTEVLGYEIKELLGEGGMASVWLAEQPTLETRVAIKVLDHQLAKDKNLVARFLDEARIQVKLRHPNVVKIENFSMDDLAIVMEYVPGSPLDEVIGTETGPIPVERAMPMMRQILGAVGAAHQMDIVHRDLKPSNIVKTPEGQVKVMDFGIAKVLGAKGRTRTGTSMGTPDYMAPEQIKGAKDVGPTADIYALGVTFYEMLAGRTPFQMDPEAHSEFEMMEAQIYKDPPDPREFYGAIPEAVVEVLFKALEKDPADRHQSIEELLAALEQATQQGGEPAKEAGSAKPVATVLEEPATKKPAPTVVEEPATRSSAATVIEEPASGRAAVTVVEEPYSPPVQVPVPRAGLSTGAMAGIGVGLLVVIGLGVMIMSRSKPAPVVTSPDDDDDDDKDNGRGRSEAPSAPTSQPSSTASAPLSTPASPASKPASVATTPPHVVEQPSAPPAPRPSAPSWRPVSGVTDVDYSPVASWRMKAARKLNSSGMRYHNQKNYREAMLKFRSALEQYPGHTYARYNLACGYALTGDAERALGLLEQLKAHVNDPRCKLCAGQIKHARKDPDFRSLRGNPRLNSILR